MDHLHLSIFYCYFDYHFIPFLSILRKRLLSFISVPLNDLASNPHQEFHTLNTQK